MTALNSFILKELFESSAIVGADNDVIYAGSSFNNIFGGMDLAAFLKNGSSEKDSLSQKLRDSRRQNEPSTYRIKENDAEILIRPLGDGLISINCMTIAEDIITAEHNLKERIKELDCLYSISSELDKHRSFDEFIDGIIPLITRALQDPDNVKVNIEIDKKVFGNTSSSRRDTFNILSSPIERNQKRRGEIRVYGLNNIKFLQEEQRLINEIATRISRFIEREEKHYNFEKQQKILTAKNEALLKMTQECYEKREKLRTFFRAITDNIVVIDQEFNITMSNKDEIGETGKCFKKLFNQEQPCSNCPAKITFRSSQDFWSDKELKKHYYRLWTYPIFGIKGEVEKVLEVCRDISDQKEIEAKLIQSYKLASLGKLVAGVAHEINNPNTFILGNLKIIKEAFEDIFPILDSRYAENEDMQIARLDYNFFKENISILINDMLNGANRTKKIVGDLRNFAKKDEDQLTESVDMNDIIKNNLTLTQKQIKKYAKLETELNENLPLFRGNINKLEQVLLNLTMNASEAIQDGEGVVKIKTDYNAEHEEVLLIVSDNGCGMDESTLKKIFDPFYTTKRNKGGTGLGLSITYGIIKDHNGRIEVKSRPGEGTTFTIHIPVKEKKLK